MAESCLFVRVGFHQCGNKVNWCHTGHLSNVGSFDWILIWFVPHKWVGGGISQKSTGCPKKVLLFDQQ